MISHNLWYYVNGDKSCHVLKLEDKQKETKDLFFFKLKCMAKNISVDIWVIARYAMDLIKNCYAQLHALLVIAKS